MWYREDLETLFSLLRSRVMAPRVFRVVPLESARGAAPGQRWARRGQTDSHGATRAAGTLRTFGPRKKGVHL